MTAPDDTSPPDRLLVLNSGAAWTAYQVGALGYLLRDRQLHFDMCAGTGMGALHAAFVACGAFDALASFWQRIGWLRLFSINKHMPLRDGPLSHAPLHRFVREHVSEEKLRARGTRLVFSGADLRTGREQLFVYPGGNVPLYEALQGALALPGLTPSLHENGSLLVQGTVVNGFILNRLLTRFPAREIYAVAALAVGTQPEPPRRYDNWREVLLRTVQLNFSHDVQAEARAADKKIAEVRAYAAAHERLSRQVDERLDDPDRRSRVQERLAQHFEEAHPLLEASTPPSFHKVLTSRPIPFPFWRFNRQELQVLMEMGRADAHAALRSHDDATQP